jgi:hypothetical protein
VSEFRTVIKAVKSDWEISHKDKVLMLGSCFTDNVGQKLLQDKFDVLSNPFGTLFNPLALVNLVSRALDDKMFMKEEFFFENELWHHWSLNTGFVGPNLDELLESCNKQLLVLQEALISANFLIITLGTAWVYRLKSQGEVVANCHKMDAALFDKICLSADEIQNVLAQGIDKCKGVNPDLKTLITLSPVRHWKDGAIDNSLSKSTLRLAIEQTLYENVRYFPSYEIMMDDLRDYRFYEKDLLHPSEMAVEYIYKFFEESFFTKSTSSLIGRINKLQQAMNHRPVHPESKNNIVFQNKIEEELRSIDNDHPELANRYKLKGLI